MHKTVSAGLILLAGSVLPAWAGPFGWNAEFCRKLEITSPTPCKLTLKSAGSLQVMHLDHATPVVETLSEAGDSVEIAKAVSGSWWIGFSREDPAQEPSSPRPVELDLELSAQAGTGKVRVPFHVTCQLTEPKVQVRVALKRVDARLVFADNCTFIKSPFAIVQQTRDEDLLIKVGD